MTPCDTERVQQPPRPLIDSEVIKHTAGADFDPSLITVTHTPNGVVTHLVAADSKTPTVQMEHGRVITKIELTDYGTVLAVLGGPAVVEVALHHTADQRDAYRAAVDAVDQEAMSHLMIASRTAVLTILQQLGMPDGDAPEPAPDPDDGPRLWAQLRAEHGPCTCAAGDDDTACDLNCALCAALPANAWPCPAWSGSGFGPDAVAER